MKVTSKSDPNGMQALTDTAQVFLANSITFAGKTSLLDTRKARGNLAFVHRVDGPYYMARYARSLETLEAIPKEDQQTVSINERYACATVFQSTWSMNANLRIGLNLRNPVLVPNTVNPIIYFPQENKTSVENRKINIIASSHSTAPRKGFDTMMWVDKNLDFARFNFMYIGGKPKDFLTSNIVQRAEAPSEGVADALRGADIYFAPSRGEPASNAVLEALACGLPVLYQEGSSHEELVGEGGVGFAGTGPGLLKSLDELVLRYEYHRSRIRIPTIKEVTRRYLSIMRWCFFMRNTIL